MVVADASLLRDVRRLAIRDELLAMRLRGMLVVPQVAAAPHDPMVGSVTTRNTAASDMCSVGPGTTTSSPDVERSA